MFKGSNTIRMNQATLIEALQEYLDARVSNNARENVITSIKAAPGVEGGFEVTLEEKAST